MFFSPCAQSGALCRFTISAFEDAQPQAGLPTLSLQPRQFERSVEPLSCSAVQCLYLVDL